MLKPKQMSRAVIVGHKNILEETVDALHKANLFHIEDFNEDDSDLKIGKPFESGSEVSKKLVKIRSIASLLGVKDVAVEKQSPSEICSQLDSSLDKLDDELEILSEKKRVFETELKELGSSKKDILPFIGTDLDLDLYRGYESLAVFAGHVKEDIGPSVSQLTSSYELYYDQHSGVVVLFVSKDKAAEVSELLARVSFKELKVPNLSGIPSGLIADIEQKEADISKKIEAIDADIEALKLKYADFILASNEMLSIEVQKSEAPLRIATTESSFLIDGWLPTEQYAEMERTVNTATNGRAFVSPLEITKPDIKKVPIEYDNPKIVSPLQEIMNLYGRPTYKELDPSALIFITFPLLYGMILGDIGYALILLIMALAIKKIVSSDAVKPLMNILIYCQISTLFFGILYGEFLGFPLAAYHGQPGLLPGFDTIDLLATPFPGEVIGFPLHRSHLVMTFIVATVFVGLLHLNLGYAVGFINEKRKHGISAAIFEKGSWFVVQFGILLTVLGYLEMLPIVAGIVVFLIGVVMLVKGEGVKGPIELPSLLSNSLSYTRIIAVGLSSISIASTVNLIAFDMIWPPGSPIGGMTIFAIVVFLFGHALNTALSIIAPGLHALRLQYVEFFGKFYEGGGRKYDPFGYIRKYTEEK
ncbi:V-type ATP synthase subunit I [Methanolobus sp.]|uniref:V-type ATP synthase subunit I n=1 Tax=Methanolobus sp. TaxID=1874737 RepID=UPI0026014A7E|nr:V-type ATP synthase subunit I [Methanolobus sp.]